MSDTKFKACLFDMDGTLLNTEDIYTEVTTELLAEYGKGPLTWDVKIKLQGLPGPHANELVVKHYELPINPDEYSQKVMAIQATKWHKAKFLPGAKELLTHLKSNNVPIALGTSSNTTNFNRKTAHLPDFLEFFGDQVVTGDDTRIPRGKGKPHPYIWYTCLDQMNQDRQSKGLDHIKPHECLIFEDGIPGVYSGLAADAHVIWIPHQDAHTYIQPVKKQFEEKNVKLEVISSLVDFETSKYLE